MSILFYVSILLSSVSFLWYGIAVLVNDGMVDEFARFGLSQYRRMTGGLEVLGGLGLLAGLVWAPLLAVSAAGLSLLMLLGVVTRIRVRDPWMQTLPAIVLLLLNLFVTVYAIGSLRDAPA